MITNLRHEIDSEIFELIEKLENHSPDFQHEDGRWMEFKTPYLTNPDSRNEEWKNKIGIVFYPELLSYTERYVNPETNELSRMREHVTIPWICVRFELEGDQSISMDLCKWLVSIFKEIKYTPFKDEDATYNHFAKEESRGYTKYKMYVNPSYPNGMWENHTL